LSEQAFEDRLDQLLGNPKYKKHAKVVKDSLDHEQEGVELTIKAILNALPNLY
jgi:Mn-dependent DtxR family transcriptional regulator